MKLAAMNIEEIRAYCLAKPYVSEGLPFGDDTLVFKVHEKMFALANLDSDLSLNLKCEPEKAMSLREQYPAVTPGYHMNKMHWNTVVMDGSLTKNFICGLIDHSYELVWNSLPKKLRI